MPQKGGNHKHHGGDSVDVDHSSGDNDAKHHHVYAKDLHKGSNGSKGNSKDPNVTKCCVPTGCNLNLPIRMEDLNDCVKVICNNENCNQGRYMHKSCFESWEESVLTFLRSTGRARSWSEKQRLQNLWTKKGYDLAYKACGCKCGKGHLRKDLDWTAPVTTNTDETGKKKKNRKKKTNDKPTLIISTSMSTFNGSSSSSKSHVPISTGNSNLIGSTNLTFNGALSSSPSSANVSVLPISRFRTSSMSSSGSAGSGGTSPPGSGSESLSSPGFLDQSAFMKKFFGAAEHHQQQQQPPPPTTSSPPNATSTISQPNQQYHHYHHQQPHQHHHHFHHDNTGRRVRRDSGSIFSRRQDYSSFNNLPRHKLNSYHIKMEDDHGNDETRNFILSTLSANRMNRISCIMCHTSMLIFDKYPLIDGTLFLSPTQHSKGAVPTTVENGSKQYLNAVCMGCLEGWNSIVKCRSCSTQWKGHHLILGSMYSYDIFAAVPCCTDRLRCNSCKNLVISPDQRLQFFSHYSNSIACGHCGIVDFHFAKHFQVNFIRTGRD